MAKAEYRSAQRSRRLIQQALAELLQEKSVDKITVTEVVRQADINRGTFYAHYSSVQDAVRAVIDEQFQVITEIIRCGITEGRGPDPRAIMTHIKEIIGGNLDFYRKACNSATGQTIMGQLRNVLMEYLLEYEEEFSGMNHEYYIFMVSFATGGAIALFQDWFAGKLPLSLDAVSDMAADVLCTMLELE